MCGRQAVSEIPPLPLCHAESTCRHKHNGLSVPVKISN